MVERSRAARTVKDAEEARDELRAALKGAGVTLPSLALDGVSLVGDFPRPLVDLGRCTPQTARRLAGVLRGDVR
ncbi:hypothetical protein ACH4LK_11415 [Streptomyces lydicus]|uniref:hypothetical protein n=1 Tax=Streptomyces lydicus TaxID=47763 RepID=UPI0037B361C7